MSSKRRCYVISLGDGCIRTTASIDDECCGSDAAIVCWMQFLEDEDEDEDESEGEGESEGIWGGG